jgi:quinol monooxygenase YgiN
MVVVHIALEVHPDHASAFEAATRDNARGSRQEAGNLRFDVLRRADAPTHFILYEVFRDREAQQAHRETAHYQRWKELTTPWILNRTVTEFDEVYIVGEG